MVRAIPSRRPENEVVETTVRTPGFISGLVDSATCSRMQTKPCWLNGTLPLTDHWAKPSTLVRGACVGGLMLTAATPSIAQPVYKIVNDHSTVTFANSPSSDTIAEKQPINVTNTIPTLQRSREIIATNRPEPCAQRSVQFETRITALEDQTAIALGPGNLAEKVAVRPRLGTAENHILTLDEEPLSAPRRSAGWQLSNVFRGGHRLLVLRLDANGTQQDVLANRLVYISVPRRPELT